MFIAVAVIVPASLAFAQLDASSKGGQSEASATPEVNPMWLDRLSKEDREFVDENIGYAPPAMTSELKWVGTEPLSWDKLRGKVVVLQSWTSRNAAGRKVPQRLEAARKQIESDDVVMLALHTPEGAENVDTYLERQAVEGIVAIDPDGAFCDALGFYRRPTNVLIDRNGEIRYAGLRLEAIDEAASHLLEEEVDETKQPKPRDVPSASGEVAFPKVTGSVSHAKDIRNQKAPDFHVAQWVNTEAKAGNRVVIIDFWATWCGPCVAAIPHMNKLADGYRDDVVCIGLSDEKSADFQKGMQRLQSRNITLQSFHYHVALDPQAKMKSAIAIRGIPHVVVISSDWIVRWQGHPMQLDEKTLEQIIAANKTLKDGGGVRNRWANSKKS